MMGNICCFAVIVICIYILILVGSFKRGFIDSLYILFFFIKKKIKKSINAAPPRELENLRHERQKLKLILP